MWLYSSEFEAWRLYIASPIVDSVGPREAYVRLLSAIRSSDPDLASEITITLVSPKEPLIRGLRRVFGTTKSVHGMRLGNNVIDGVFIEHAYVYRIK